MKETKETRRVNKAAQILFKAIDRFLATAAANGSPIRSVSCHVDNTGHTKTTVRYQAKKK